MYQLVPVSQETYTDVLELCHRYAKERDAEWLVHVDTWEGLLVQMIAQGTAYVLLRDSVPIGVFLMVKHLHAMNNTLVCLTPMVMYIVPEYRNGRGLSMMFDVFETKSKEVGFSAISFGPGANISENTMKKYGYKVLETVYVKE